ncbi:MAG: CinA family nicotinamide mononucleotide deamidase-related protein [Anaerolineales bacterium]|nr:CinA family nicotinamide mononucleotide deamidase-related protein [Anaerolineales bacterium]
MKAEILTIGTELLLGEITDTNTGFLARSLASIGVNVYRTTSVGDNEERIADAIREILARVDLLITTGGLGPTVDDPTRDAVALALNLPVEFHLDLWETIQEYFNHRGLTASENNRRQAYLPQGAEVIFNPVGTAPAFLVETEAGTLISLPGVPFEMETLMVQSVLPAIRSRFEVNGIIQARLLHTVGVGESRIDEKIGVFETYSNPTVGLAAHAGQVDIRLTARAENEEEAQKMLDPLEQEVRNLLGDRIYGVDDTSLEEAALQPYKNNHQTVAVIESGLGGQLSAKLGSFPDTFHAGLVLPTTTIAECTKMIEQEALLRADVILVAVFSSREENLLELQLHVGETVITQDIHIPGPAAAAMYRACTHALDFLRTQFQSGVQ